jgi:sirohydrochlorin cobaltochelatase
MRPARAPCETERSRVRILHCVNSAEFQDATLVLVGHGSISNPDSRRVVDQLGAAFQIEARFAAVRTGFWRHEPRVRDVLTGLSTARVFVVPIFMSEGYFTEEVIPRELGLQRDCGPGFDRVRRQAGREVHYCAPVGTHPSMTDVIVRQAQETVLRHPATAPVPGAALGLAIAGHGTERNGNSRRAIEDHVGRIRARGVFADVVAMFIEEEPRIADWPRLTGASRVVVVPFFVSEGLHTAEDLPVLLGLSAETVQLRRAQGRSAWENPARLHGRDVWCTPAVGSDSHVAEVVLARVRESARQAMSEPQPARSR